MSKEIRLDGFFISLVLKCSNLIILNFLFMLTCIPIITIGPAVVAMYTITLKMVKDKESSIVKSYFRAVKENMRQGVLIGLIISIIIFVVYIDVYVLFMPIFIGYKCVLLGIIVLCIFVSSYIFPMCARYKNTIFKYFNNSIVLSCRHLYSSIIIMILNCIPIICFFAGQVIFGYIIIVYTIIGFALTSFLNSFLFTSIYEKYEK